MEPAVEHAAGAELLAAMLFLKMPDCLAIDCITFFKAGLGVVPALTRSETTVPKDSRPVSSISPSDGLRIPIRSSENPADAPNSKEDSGVRLRKLLRIGLGPTAPLESAESCAAGIEAARLRTDSALGLFALPPLPVALLGQPRFFFPDWMNGDGTANPSTICIGDRACTALGVLRRNTDGEKLTPAGPLAAGAGLRVRTGEVSKISPRLSWKRLGEVSV
jgi:hypothetical protein